MADTTSNTIAFLAGILFCPPYANTTARLVAGPDVIRFNRLFDATTDVLMEICRDIRLNCRGLKKQMVALPAEPLADLMMGLALQLSLIASHLADCQGWKTDDIREILMKAETLPPPLKSVFQPDLRFWQCLLSHRSAPPFLETFNAFDEPTRIRCLAVLTSAVEPQSAIDRFVAADDKNEFIAGRLREARKKTRTDGIDDVVLLKQAIAWSISASTAHPTVASS